MELEKISKERRVVLRSLGMTSLRFFGLGKSSLLGGMLGVISFLTARAEVPLRGGESPDGRFVVWLEYDRKAGRELPQDTAPDLRIVDQKSRETLARLAFPADPNSDERPFRDRVRVYWNGDGSGVAISSDERHYTHLHVFLLKGTLSEPKSFEAVSLPDTHSIIRSMTARFKEFRSRWHHHFQGWVGTKTIQFSAGAGAIIEPLADGSAAVMAVYSFTVNYREPEMPIIRRIERLEGDD